MRKCIECPECHRKSIYLGREKGEQLVCLNPNCGFVMLTKIQTAAELEARSKALTAAQDENGKPRHSIYGEAGKPSLSYAGQMKQNGALPSKEANPLHSSCSESV